MGMFDSVMVRCPKCARDVECQSKGGDCLLKVYRLETAPADVLSDVNRHAPHKCACGQSFTIKVHAHATVETPP